jgi:hypothetical protein
MKHTIPLFVAILITCSCELYEQDEYEEYYVVESYLVAGSELPQVRLSKTTNIDETYDFNNDAVRDASVQINLLADDSTVTETYSYQELGHNTNQSGIYLPVSDVRVQPERLYQLHIMHEDNEITSTTFVPGDFETVNELQDRYVYQGNEQVEIETTPSAYITDRQTYYIFTINTASPEKEALTPFYLDLVENQDAELEDFYINSSGIINEKNYDKNETGTITLRVPWLAIAYFGENDVIVNTIDDNMYDFLRSQDVQTGGTTLSPGEIQNIQYNVNGGIGIFGSMASDTNRVDIVRPNSN